MSTEYSVSNLLSYGSYPPIVLPNLYIWRWYTFRPRLQARFGNAWVLQSYHSICEFGTLQKCFHLSTEGCLCCQRKHPVVSITTCCFSRLFIFPSQPSSNLPWSERCWRKSNERITFVPYYYSVSLRVRSVCNSQSHVGAFGYQGVGHENDPLRSILTRALLDEE